MKYRSFSLEIKSLVVTILMLTACGENTSNRGFYYWKSGTIQSTEEIEMLKKSHTDKLYLKFFEVVHDTEFKQIPIDKTTFSLLSIPEKLIKVDKKFARNFKGIEIIPTIFIEESCLRSNDSTQMTALAKRMCGLITKTFETNIGKSHVLNEVQIDCDWTPSTRTNYFILLKEIKAMLKVKLSCTLRLYPFKYPDLVGVPPVDRCMLMCYNLIGPKGNPEKNSILDVNELKLYVKNSKTYPLPLDVALPIFSWLHHYQQNQFLGLIQTSDKGFLKNLKQGGKSLWYTVTQDHVIGNRYVRRGDRIKWEKLTPKIIENAILVLKENVHLDSESTLTFFDLNPSTSSNFSYENISSFHVLFNK
jgi:hypothetical protein